MRALFAELSRKPTAFLRGTAVIGLFVVLAGCGGPKSHEPTVDIKVNLTITTVPDAARFPQEFSRLFAKGVTVPEANREKYTGYAFFSYSMDVSGNNATAQVTVRDNNANEVGKVEWTLVLEDEVWKLKTAPLP